MDGKVLLRKNSAGFIIRTKYSFLSNFYSNRQKALTANNRDTKDNSSEQRNKQNFEMCY